MSLCLTISQLFQWSVNTSSTVACVSMSDLLFQWSVNTSSTEDRRTPTSLYAICWTACSDATWQRWGRSSWTISAKRRLRSITCLAATSRHKVRAVGWRFIYLSKSPTDSPLKDKSCGGRWTLFQGLATVELWPFSDRIHFLVWSASAFGVSFGLPPSRSFRAAPSWWIGSSSHPISTWPFILNRF